MYTNFLDDTEGNNVAADKIGRIGFKVTVRHDSSEDTQKGRKKKLIAHSDMKLRARKAKS